MASRSLLRCVKQGLVTRHSVPAAAASVVTTKNNGTRCHSINPIKAPPKKGEFQWFRMATYCAKYFVALCKDVPDWELDLGQTDEQRISEYNQIRELKRRANDVELLKTKPIQYHEMVHEMLKIYRAHDNWMEVNAFYCGCLTEEQMYDYIDPVFMQEIEDWLLAVHPRWKLYDIQY